MIFVAGGKKKGQNLFDDIHPGILEGEKWLSLVFFWEINK